MKKIAIIGTQGIPAQYGGFESLAENLVTKQCAKDIQYTVYCSEKAYKNKLKQYKQALLEYVNFDANGAQSIVYDILSLIRATKRNDVVLVLGVSGCCVLPIYRLFARKKRLLVNIDGLEHRREKWGKWTKKFLKFSEKMAVKYADVIIADNKGIQAYVKDEYDKDSELIAYGGNHVLRNVDAQLETNVLKKYVLFPKDYAITVCRIEPENNCHDILEAFSKTNKKMVFIGNWNRSNYGRLLKDKYTKCPNISILDPIYDIDILYILRKNAGMYIHGHSAGGTNPSLVEAMFFNSPILCYDVVYNRETTEQQAYYWANVDELVNLLKRTDLSAEAMNIIAHNKYTWETITMKYEMLY